MMVTCPHEVPGFYFTHWIYEISGIRHYIPCFSGLFSSGSLCGPRESHRDRSRTNNPMAFLVPHSCTRRSGEVFESLEGLGWPGKQRTGRGCSFFRVPVSPLITRHAIYQAIFFHADFCNDVLSFILNVYNIGHEFKPEELIGSAPPPKSGRPASNEN